MRIPARTTARAIRRSPSHNRTIAFHWPDLEMACRAALSPLLRFELLYECSEMRGDGSRQGVVLVFEALPNCRQPNASIASGIQPALRGMVLKHMPTNPVVERLRQRDRALAAPMSPPPAPRRLTNASTVGRVSDKGKNGSPNREPRPLSEGGVSGTLHQQSSIAAAN
jgi:hypothetical protein